MDRGIIHGGTIAQSILLIRGEKVILASDLAGFYGVKTMRLNEQVKRNKDRFPYKSSGIFYVALLISG